MKGYQVEEANQQPLETLTASRRLLVLLALQMQVIKTRELLQRANPKTKEIPVVIISGFDSSDRSGL